MGRVLGSLLQSCGYTPTTLKKTSKDPTHSPFPPPLPFGKGGGKEKRFYKKSGLGNQIRKKGENSLGIKTRLFQSRVEDARDWPGPVSVRGAQLRDFL
jgi:hypothetical protein